MIKEVIVVEGKQDIAAVRRSVEADCIATGGFTLSPHTVKQIEHAYQKRGIVILTDPDSAGERIRRFLAQRFPQAKHAFVPREAAHANDDIGIEQASPEAIRSALHKARTQEMQPTGEFTQQDLIDAALTGTPDASVRRTMLGERLGVGYANAKGFLTRLNHYGVTREEFLQALEQLEETV
jgi:ribonuclease M5